MSKTAESTHNLVCDISEISKEETIICKIKNSIKFMIKRIIRHPNVIYVLERPGCILNTHNH